jgi:hypothetical protein
MTGRLVSVRLRVPYSDGIDENAMAGPMTGDCRIMGVTLLAAGVCRGRDDPGWHYGY